MPIKERRRQRTPSGQKGAIELSLGFIVAVVFAVVLLSLALLWLQGMFNPIKDITHKTTEIATQQLLTQLSTGNKKVGIAAPDVTTWRRGETGSFALGIKNDDVNNQKTYYPFVYLESLGGDLKDTPVTSIQTDVNKWISLNPITLPLDPNSKDTLAVIIKPTGNAATGIYLFRACACTTYDVTCHAISPGVYETASPSLYGCASFSIEIE